MLITTSVVDFNFDLLLLDTLYAPVDIEHCWLVVIRERVTQVIGDQAGLADGGVTREHELESLCSCLIRSPSLTAISSSISATFAAVFCSFSFFLIFSVRCWLHRGRSFSLLDLFDSPVVDLFDLWFQFRNDFALHFFDLSVSVFGDFFN